MSSLVNTIREMQEAAMTARQKKAIAAIEKDKNLSGEEKFKKIDAVMKEEEQVDEISKKKLGDYVKGASKDAASKAAYGAQLARDGDTEKGGKMAAKAYNRTKNIGKAVDKLTKEEVEMDEALKPFPSKSEDIRTVNSLREKRKSRELTPKEKGMLSRAENRLRSQGVKFNKEEVEIQEHTAVDTQMSHSMSLLDTVNAILMGRRDELDEAKKAVCESCGKVHEGKCMDEAKDEKDPKMDKVDKKALKKDYDDRKDKDIDNDGDEDDSDEYLHKKRQAVSKAIDKKDDAPKKKAKKPESQAEPVDVEPTLGESEMSDSEEKKREEIVMKLKSKKDEFKKKYGDRWEKVMYATATKMAMKK